MRGIVSPVSPATRTNRTAQMTLTFDQVTINGVVYPMRGTLMQALSTSGAKEAAKVGTAAGIGAIIGGILGGGQGAAIGAGIGGGGIVAATPGSQVQLEQGTTLRVRLDAALQVR
jgi:outer membrane lipoprotein SlyB